MLDDWCTSGGANEHLAANAASSYHNDGAPAEFDSVRSFKQAWGSGDSTWVAQRGARVGWVGVVENAGRSEPGLGAIPRVDSYDDLVFPLDAYHLTPEQRISLARADDVLVRDCMRRYGFDFQLPDRTVQPELENRVIGLVEESSAAQLGYKPAGFDEHMKRVSEEQAGEMVPRNDGRPDRRRFTKSERRCRPAGWM